MICSGCQKDVATTTDRLPRGWKRLDGAPRCKDCVAGDYVLRAATIPVAEVMDEGGWAELRPHLKQAFTDATRIANWAVRELAKVEPARTHDMERMPKLPRVYLYPGARALAPAFEPTSVTALLAAVERRYRARRLQCYWFCAEALPTYTYPAPVPVHNASWQAITLEDGRPAVSVRLGGRRWTLRLRGGAEFHRQLRDHASLVAGRAIQGELALIEKRAHAGDRRSQGTGQGKRAATRLMLKLVARYPRPERAKRTGVLHVRTLTDAAFAWRAGDDGDEHRYCADHVRHWLVQHRRNLQRWADDLQHHHRWPKEVRQRMLADHDATLQKQRNRMASWVKESCAMLVRAAQRYGCSELCYDDSVREYAALPWAALRDRLKSLCDARGVQLTIASGEVVSPEAGALAQ